MQILLLAAYCSVLIVLCTYGAHRANLVYTCWRHRRRIQVGERRVEISEDALPTVTVQLPIFNEATVSARLIEATGKLDYPAHKFEIQVLDDSTDETLRIAREAVAALVARGIDAKHVRRPNRHGYKAGASTTASAPPRASWSRSSTRTSYRRRISCVRSSVTFKTRASAWCKRVGAT